MLSQLYQGQMEAWFSVKASRAGINIQPDQKMGDRDTTTYSEGMVIIPLQSASEFETFYTKDQRKYPEILGLPKRVIPINIAYRAVSIQDEGWRRSPFDSEHKRTPIQYQRSQF